MIDYMIEFLEGWKAASAFEQVAAFASIIAVLSAVFFWFRHKVRLSIHDKDREITKLKGQLAGYRGMCEEYEAKLEMFEKRTVDSRLQMIAAELADQNEERAYVLYEELLEHLKPAIDEACAALASARAADIPISGMQAKDEAIRLAKIVVGFGGDNAERMRMLLLELYGNSASDAIHDRNDATRASALNGLAQSFYVPDENSESLRKAAFHAYEEGKYILAEVLFRRLFVIFRRTGSPESLFLVQSSISSCLSMQGRYVEAEAQFRDVLEHQISVLGKGNPSVLKTRQSLAVCIDNQGRYTEAEAQFRDVLEHRISVLGEEHPDTLYTKHTLADCISSQGRYAEAEAQYRDVLERQISVLGEEHPDTLITRQLLARCICSQGRYTEAEAQFRDVLKRQISVLGEEHPDTLKTRRDLADCIDNQSRNAEAEAQ